MKSKAGWIWFAEKCGCGSTEMLTIYEKFGSIRDVYLGNYDDYLNYDIRENLIERLLDKSLDNAYQIIDRCKELGIEILCYTDDNYPQSLRSLPDAPAVLYYVGKLPNFNKSLCVATVGTRNMSEYGMRAAYKIAYEIASAGAVVVSGMALGIDSVTHCAALEAGGTTVAVLGCGVDVVYPKANAALYNAIKSRGAIISEYPPSSKPYAFHFPERNRIISGLSQGVAIIDADIDSGSMITARCAIMQGRNLFAVPCNIDSPKSGTNVLIRDGAQAIVSGSDVIRNYIYDFKDIINEEELERSKKRSELKESALASIGIRFKKRTDGAARVSDEEKNESAEIPAQKRKSPSKAKTSESESKPAFVRAGESEEKTYRENEIPTEREDDSRAALESLSEAQRKVFEEMPLDRAVSVDYLVSAGFRLAQVIAALTVLEVKGLVSSLPGALYVRK